MKIKYLLLLLPLLLAGCGQEITDEDRRVYEEYETRTRVYNEGPRRCHNEEALCEEKCIDNYSITVDDCIARCELKEDKCKRDI